MTFEIELNGARRAVSVESSSSGRYRVTIDGEPHDVLAERAGEYGVSLILLGAALVQEKIKDSGVVSPIEEGAAGEMNGASYEIQVAPGATAGELLLGFRGKSVAATVNGRRRARPGTDTGGHVHGEQAVKAPMPGRVVKVLVGVGDEVTLRQPVVVVEAMKMENELRAPKAGRVRDVTVTPGMSVEAGRVLIVIE